MKADDRHLTPQEIAERYLSPDKSPIAWLTWSSIVCAVVSALFMALTRFSIWLLIVGLVLAMLAFCGLLIALIVKMMAGPSRRELANDRATLMAGRYRDIQVHNRSTTINGVTVGQGTYIVLQVLSGKNIELWITDGGDVERIVMMLTANMLQRTG